MSALADLFSPRDENTARLLAMKHNLASPAMETLMRMIQSSPDRAFGTSNPGLQDAAGNPEAFRTLMALLMQRRSTPPAASQEGATFRG